LALSTDHDSDSRSLSANQKAIEMVRCWEIWMAREMVLYLDLLMEPTSLA